MRLSKDAVNERLDYLKRMRRGAGWDGMRAKRIREIQRNYLEPLAEFAARKPGSAPAQAVRKEIARVEAELKAAEQDDPEVVRIASEIIAIGYMQQDGSMGDVSDFDEAVSLWGEKNLPDCGYTTGVVLTKSQERIVRARWDNEFRKER